MHLATFLNAPVSTTHAVVGGVVGAGVAAAGFNIVVWPVIGAVVMSWIISPILGGLVAALLLGFIKWTIIYRDDRIAAARRWMPLMMALMVSVFVMYLIAGAAEHLAYPSLVVAIAGIASFAGIPWRGRGCTGVTGIENRRKSEQPVHAAAGLGRLLCHRARRQ